MKIICSIVLFQFTILNVIGQNSPGLKTFITPSPTATSLGKYGEIPVSLYTGIPNINIPIYTVKGRELELPISLSYHAGGHRVEEIASWVGLGWSLNAGGVITRTIRGGFPDFASAGYFTRIATVTALAKKYLINRSPTTSYLKGSGNAEAADLNTLDQVMSQTYDSEADIYSFNFGKYSGKFFLSENGQLVVTPVQALKIEYDFNSGIAPGDVASWTVTTPDGVKYIFGNSLNALKKNSNGAITGNTITSWYLLQIISPGNETIDFDYTNVSYSYESKSGEVINQIVYETANPPAHLPPLDKRIITNYITMPKLRSITYTKGKVIFDATVNRNDLTGDTYLSAINIFSSTDLINPLKKYSLAYTNGTRLRLNDLTEISSTTPSLVNKYGFEYSTQSLPNPNPNGTAINSQDLWGYYNGVPNSVLPQSHSIQGTAYGTINIYGADRHSDETFMQAEILNKITYPTGGYTQFDYEANRVYALNTDNSIPPPALIKQASTTCEPPSGTGESTFVVQDPDPITGDVTVSVSSRQMMSGCPIDQAGNSSCYLATIQGINGTQFPLYSFPVGSSSIKLKPGTYKITLQGQYYPGQPASNPVHLDLQWSEYPLPAGSTPTMVNKVIGGLRIKRIINYDGLKTNVKKYLYNKLSDSAVSSGVLLNNPWPYASIFQLTGEGSTIYAQVKSYPLIPLMPTQGSAIGYENVTELIGENGEGGKTEYTFTTATDFADEIQQYRPYPPSCSYDWRRGQLLRSVSYKNNGGDFLPVKSVSNHYAFAINPQTGYGLTVEKDIQTVPGGTYTYVPNSVDYYVSGYKTVSEFYYLQSDTARLFDQNNPSNFIETITNYDYDITKGHYQLIKQKTKNSKGEVVTTNLKYPLDYTITGTPNNNTASGIKKLQDNHIINPVIEQYIQKANADASNSRTVSAVLNTFKPTNALPDVTYAWESAGTATDFNPATINASSFTKDSHYQPKVSIDSYDNNGNILQQHKSNDVNHSYIWGYNNTLPIAEAINAPGNEIFFNAFEEGGWNVNMQYDNSFSHSGKYAGKIVKTTAGELFSLSTTWLNISLTGTKKFHYSGWIFSNGPSAQLFFYMKKAGEAGSYTYADNVQTTITNQWVFVEKDFIVPADVTQLNIRVDNNGGGTVWFDDIRLHPSDAQMTTYTYAPLIGMTSQCDINNRITYYEFDDFGRLKLIRDKDKNIVKKICYNYAGQIAACDAPTSVTITNLVNLSGFVATYTNVSTGAQSSFTVPTTGSTTITLPQGTYNMVVNRSTGNTGFIFRVCQQATNCGTTINNITVNASSCNTLTVDSL